MKSISRRHFTKTSIGMLLGASGVVLSQDNKDDWRHRWNMQTDPQARGLTAYLNHGNLFVRYDNLPVLNYRAYSSLKYPYFSPLIGPLSGLALTSESALPYPHHRGVWLGCEPMEGGDYWGDTPLGTGQIRSSGIKLYDAGEEGVVKFTDHCTWIREGSESPLEDRRTFKITIPGDNIRLLECAFVITALKDITITRAKHAFFAIRCAPDIAPTYGGTLMNSEGASGAEGTYGKQAGWCSYFGPRSLRSDIIEGIAVMNHPENFGGNCPWFTRDYGHLSPQPFEFLKEPFHLSKGQALELRYCIVLHGGTPEQAGLNSVYEKWIKSAV